MATMVCGFTWVAYCAFPTCILCTVMPPLCCLQPLQQQLKETVKLLGDNTLQFTANAATVLVKAAQKIGKSIPGPSLHSLLVDVK